MLDNAVDQFVKAVFLGKSATQFVVIYRNWILVFAILGVVKGNCIRAVHLKQRFHVIVISVPLNPFRNDFLNRATVTEFAGHVTLTVENRPEHIVPALGTNNAKTDSGNKCIHEVVNQVAVHRVGQAFFNRRKLANRFRGNMLLEIVRPLEESFSKDSIVIYSHFIPLSKNISDLVF